MCRGHRIVSCAAGATHSLALASDGSLFTWGGGKYGQLGHPALQNVNILVPDQPIVLATPHKIAALEPATLQPWCRVTSIAAGGLPYQVSDVSDKRHTLCCSMRC
jgi:alpha-tubulin suppressor-like RCC1 family protein